MATLDDADIEEAVSHLDWDREGGELVKVVEKANFAEAMEFVNGVAVMAESVNHHPDIAISWNKVTLRLSTHSEGGITQADVDLAGGIDGLTT
jgi:4a-hydroxytetrahydrobiopterin dehydratase